MTVKVPYKVRYSAQKSPVSLLCVKDSVSRRGHFWAEYRFLYSRSYKSKKQNRLFESLQIFPSL